MPVAKEWARCYTKQYRNWGNISTSRLEGAHSQLKKFLVNRLASLKTLGEAIGTKTKQQVQAYREKLHKEATYENTRFREHPLTEAIHMNVTRKAMEMTWDQLVAAEKAYKDGQTELPGCTGAFQRQWGLPCRHIIFTRFLTMKSLGYSDFSRHWWLWEPEKSVESLSSPLKMNLF